MTADTFERSCQHWSEDGRRNMEDFYALASVDYRHLAASRPWGAWLEARQAAVGARPLRLLDVACGSGKFPAALLRDSDVAGAKVKPIAYDLLDPSAFSIAEARGALAAPFEAQQEHEVTLQDFRGRDYDIVWATHALYALPVDELAEGLSRFLDALGPQGEAFIAHASESAHYVAFYRVFLRALRGGEGTPYTNAEQIESVLRQLGASVEVEVVQYDNGAPDTERDRVEGYLQRCVFDDSVTLDQMLGHPDLAAYLDRCLVDGRWRFPQTVHLLSITR
jgi:SAM-dependent methyltransferase